MKIKNIHTIKFLTFAILALLISCKGGDKNEFRIKGQLSNLNAPYFFIAHESADSVAIDTIFIDNKGGFNYSGQVDTLTIATLFHAEGNLLTSLFIDKGLKIEIKGDANLSDLIGITGGTINDDLTAFKKENKSLFESRARLIGSLQQNPDVQQTELKNTEFDLMNKAKEYIKAHPEKIASVMLIQDFLKNNVSIDLMDESLGQLRGDAASFYLVDDLKEYSKYIKSTTLGAKAPNITLKDGKGKSTDLDSFKGKYVLLSFETDDSKIYPQRISDMIKAHDITKKKNIEFVSVMIDYTKENIPDSVSWLVYFENKKWASDIIKKYNVTELPYSILISPEGKISGRNIALIDLDKTLPESDKIQPKQ